MNLIIICLLVIGFGIIIGCFVEGISNFLRGRNWGLIGGLVFIPMGLMYCYEFNRYEFILAEIITFIGTMFIYFLKGKKYKLKSYSWLRLCNLLSFFIIIGSGFREPTADIILMASSPGGFLITVVNIITVQSFQGYSVLDFMLFMLVYFLLWGYTVKKHIRY